MFTGIVQTLGRVESMSGGRLRLKAALKQIRLGGSIAVNGACLTVVKARGTAFEFDLSPETLRLTNLGVLKPRDPVNLERSLRFGDSLDGHLVSGHVDATGKILQRAPSADGSVRLRIGLPRALRGLVAHKGSVAVDGVSLTVTRLAPLWFETVLIPHTLKATNLDFRKPGDLVNLEADLIARYMQSLMRQ